MYVCLPHMCLVPDEVRVPGTGAMDGCGPPRGPWESNLGSLQEQQELLTTEQSLQPPSISFRDKVIHVILTGLERAQDGHQLKSILLPQLHKC